MARTKASVGAKISSGKSSKARCSATPATANTGVSSGSSDKAARSSGGGNPVCPRETPKWQRPITNFFINKSDDSNEVEDKEVNGSAGSSKPKPKRNIIQSSDEENSPEKPKNKELDETIELEPLTGEDSHKIQEYYSKESKGKGVGKRTVKKQNEKENLEGTLERDSNADREKNTKETEHPGKRTVKKQSEKENLEGTLERDSYTDREKNKTDKEYAESETEHLKKDHENINVGDRENSASKTENLEKDHENIGDGANSASKTENLQDTIERDTNITNNATDKENVNRNVGANETEDLDSKSDRERNMKGRSKRVRCEEQEESLSKKIKVN